MSMTASIETAEQLRRALRRAGRVGKSRNWARAIPDRELDVILSMFGSGAHAVRSVTLRAVVSVRGVLERERNRREQGVGS